MADEKEKKPKKTKSPLIGAQTEPTVLGNDAKIGIDTDKSFVDDVLAASTNGQLDTAALDNFTSISNSRDQIYQLIDTMMTDSSVASIVRTYAEDVCETADNGHIMWCESKDPNISKFINYLLNTMNVDKNVFGWAYSLIKYGDVYLRLFRESDYTDPLFDKKSMDKAYSARTQLNEGTDGRAIEEAIYMNIHAVNDPYSYYIEAVPDPGTMFELTKFGKTYGYIETPNEETGFDYLSNSFTGTQPNAGTFNYKMKSNDVHVYQADDFVHAYLDDSYSRYPEKVDIFLTEDDYKTGTNAQSYTVRRGKSLLYDSYKIWREKSLLEAAALLNRITRSSIIRTVQIEVGDMPKSQVQNTLRRVKELMEQKSAIGVGSGMVEYTNPGAFENNIYLATHNGQGAVSVGTIGGDVDVKNLADLDYWNNKFYSSYGIPKAYFGWTDDNAGFNGGSSLTILSSVYAKGVKRVQNALVQAITDAVNLILVNKGLRAYVNNFTVKMKAPSTQEEKDYRDELSNKISAISNMQSLFSNVEDRARQLEILKSLLGGLNYGDDLMAILDKEIDAANAQKAKEEEEAAAAAAAENEASNELAPAGLGSEEPPTEEIGLDNFDLNPPPGANEGFSVDGGEILTEDGEFENDLPMPEELNAHKDFSKNE